MSELKKPECIRCGACCATDPCKFGKRGENNSCTYLFFRKKIACCLLIEQDKIKQSELGIGRGCPVRGNKKNYENCKKNLEGKI
jgi:hypothetical protein